jgi:hypothetical protein
MKKAPMIRSVIRLAIGLLIVGVIAAEFSVGRDAALGVLGGGLVMILSFVGGGWAVHRLGQAAEAGMSGGAAGVVVLKLPALGLAIWTLFKHFDPIAVVAGGSVVMLGLVFVGIAQMTAPLRKEA